MPGPSCVRRGIRPNKASADRLIESFIRSRQRDSTTFPLGIAGCPAAERDQKFYSIRDAPICHFANYLAELFARYLA
jgi:hypothetical protein